MPILLYIGTALVSAIVGGITTLYMPLDYLPHGGQKYGNVGYTSISTATNLAAFPDTYNTNMTAFDNGKIDVSTTTLPNLTTLANLSTVGTITSGTWNATAISVAKGGTGTTSPTSNLVMLGNGSGGFKTVNGFGTSGQFLTSNGDATAPSWSTGVIDTTLSYNFTGTYFGVKNLYASSTVANPIYLNGVGYSFPASQGAASTTPRNDGTGAIGWFQPDVMVVASTTLVSAVATTTLAIPATAGTVLHVIIEQPTAAANGGLNVQFNADTGANYGWLSSNGSSASGANNSAIALMGTDEVTNAKLFTFDVTNEGGARKFLSGRGSRHGDGSAAVASVYNVAGTWNNTAAKITSISVGVGTSGSTLPVGTRILVISIQAVQL